MSSVRDILIIFVLLFTIGTGMFISSFIIDRVKTTTALVPAINNTPVARDILSTPINIEGKYDAGIGIVFFGLLLSVIVTGWAIGGYPILMFIYFIIISIWVFVTAIFANLWYDIVNNAIFSGYISLYPITNHIMTKLPIYCAIFGIIGIIFMFAKPFVRNGADVI